MDNWETKCCRKDAEYVESTNQYSWWDVNSRASYNPVNWKEAILLNFAFSVGIVSVVDHHFLIHFLFLPFCLIWNNGVDKKWVWSDIFFSHNHNCVDLIVNSCLGDTFDLCQYSCNNCKKTDKALLKKWKSPRKQLTMPRNKSFCLSICHNTYGSWINLTRFGY